MMLPIPRAGLLRRVQGCDEAAAVPLIEGLEITIPVGQPVVPLPEGDRYLGFLFARGETPAAVEAALREAHARLTFQIADPDEPDDTPGLLAAPRSILLPVLTAAPHPPAPSLPSGESTGLPTCGPMERLSYGHLHGPARGRGGG